MNVSLNHIIIQQRHGVINQTLINLNGELNIYNQNKKKSNHKIKNKILKNENLFK